MPFISYSNASYDGTTVGGPSSTATVSWSHTPTDTSPQDRVAVVFAVMTSANNTGTSVAVTYGGVAMTSLVTPISWKNGSLFSVFWLKDPPSGTQTVSANWTNLPGTGIAGKQFAAAALTYDNVVRAEWIGHTTGTSTTHSLNITGISPGDHTLWAHCRDQNSSFASYNQTQLVEAIAPSTPYNRFIVGSVANTTGSATSTTTTSLNEDYIIGAITLRREASMEFFNA